MRVRLGVVACVLAICALALCAPLVARSSTATPTPEVLWPTPVAQAGLGSESQGDNEAALLRAQLEVMRQYDERLLQTVYWALATAFALVLFAAGAGWYVNFRLYERDREALRSQLHSEVETQTASIGRDLKQDTEQTRSSLNETVKKMTVDLQEQADQRSKQIEKAALQAGKEAADRLQAQFKNMQREMTYMRYTASKSAAHRWRQQGVYDAELLECIESLSLAIRLVEYGSAWDWTVAEALEGLRNALEAGARPRVERVTKMTEMLGALPSKYSIEVERLRALLSEARD